jgi:hypothetical protein
MLVMLLPSFGSGSWSDCCGDRNGLMRRFMQNLVDKAQVDSSRTNETVNNLSTDFSGGVLLFFLGLVCFTYFKGFQYINTQWNAAHSKTTICQQYAQQEKSADSALMKFSDCLEKPY